MKLGADRSKLIVDIPMYGQTYRLTNPNEYGLGAPSAGPGTAGEFTRQPGMLSYYEICDRIERENWQIGPGKRFLRYQFFWYNIFYPIYTYL